MSIAQAVIAQHGTKFPISPDVRNILVTGAAGFIGSWLASHLVQQYSSYKIVVYDNLSRPAALKSLQHLENASNYKFVKGDVCDIASVLATLRDHDIDTIIHLAAQSSVDDSFENPMQSVTNNVTGTYTLLECARRMEIKRFIYMSTDEVYGPRDRDDPADEDEPLKPTNPYSASKASGEMLVHSYVKSFKLPCVTVRSNNAYGPHQYPEKIIPKFTSLISAGEKVTVMDKGLQSRCYIFVSDIVNALDTILHKHVFSPTTYALYNISTDKDYTTLDMAVRILRALGHGTNNITDQTDQSKVDELPSLPQVNGTGKSHNSETALLNQWVRWIRDRPFHDQCYFTTCARLKALGWSQKMNFDEGLQLTVNWYRQHGEGWWD